MNTLHSIESPIGPLQLAAAQGHLKAIHFADQIVAADSAAEDVSVVDARVLAQAARQLGEYFAGQRRNFSLPLAADGTEFQRLVWQALSAIPFGELRSYRDIALVVRRPRAVRAVGAANGRNPLPIVVPCHRVIGSDGSLTGFAGGLAIKRQLLELEGALAEPAQAPLL